MTSQTGSGSRENVSGDYEAESAGKPIDPLHVSSSKFEGTFDNGSTTTELRFLAKVISAAGTNSSLSYRSNFLRGMAYIFAAQYPNGGWPQVWPLEGGYHDAITYNDNAMTHVLELLNDVAGGQADFAFVPPDIGAQAAAGLKRGIECVLATQIQVEGRRTVWCQQHDMLTLRPAPARNFEMPAQVSMESADIMRFLMRLPHPDSNIIAAVDSAAAWFKRTQVRDMAYKETGTNGPEFVSAPGSGPVWARFYEIGGDRPVFGDRDRTIHDAVGELTRERREGYTWYNGSPSRALEAYAIWSRDHAQIAGAK